MDVRSAPTELICRNLQITKPIPQRTPLATQNGSEKCTYRANLQKSADYQTDPAEDPTCDPKWMREMHLQN